VTENDSDLLGALEKLARLRQNGTLSDSEFQSLKSLMLQRISTQIYNKGGGAPIKLDQLLTSIKDNIDLETAYGQDPLFLIYENTRYNLKYNIHESGKELNQVSTSEMDLLEL
jgi:hypothetical protein